MSVTRGACGGGAPSHQEKSRWWSILLVDVFGPTNFGAFGESTAASVACLVFPINPTVDLQRFSTQTLRRYGRTDSQTRFSVVKKSLIISWFDFFLENCVFALRPLWSPTLARRSTHFSRPWPAVPAAGYCAQHALRQIPPAAWAVCGQKMARVNRGLFFTRKRPTHTANINTAGQHAAFHVAPDAALERVPPHVLTESH
jgi:hypothetical protein